MMKFLSTILLLLGLGATLSLKSQESLMIHWPEEYEWKVLNNQENQQNHVLELIPGNETAENWTILGFMMSLKGITEASLDQLQAAYHQSATEYNENAKLTLLERNEEDEFPWILFKIENEYFDEFKHNESQLWFIRIGNTSTYSNFVAIKEIELEEAFIIKWSAIFKASQIVDLSEE
ncbi:MAG: hypothetical protein AAF824_17980 [Bacteroidota bacterium]